MSSPFPGMDPYLEEPGLWPDVHHAIISEMQAVLNRAVRPAYHVRVEERVYISDEDDEIHEARLEVIDRTDRSVVTVIEVLSPANKAPGSRGRASYIEKRREVMTSDSHLVEIDLLRAGTRMPTREPLPPADYLVHVSRNDLRPRGLIWPIMLAQRLPVIPIPLRGNDPEVPLDLQQILHTAYERGAYDLAVDYQRQPVPPLNDEQRQWATELVEAK